MKYGFANNGRPSTNGSTLLLAEKLLLVALFSTPTHLTHDVILTT